MRQSNPLFERIALERQDMLKTIDAYFADIIIKDTDESYQANNKLTKDKYEDPQMSDICIKTYPILYHYELIRPEGWYDVLTNMQAELMNVQDRIASDTYYPPSNQVFRALQITPLDKVKVIIIGQDPYHNPGSACGLSFSVENRNQKVNPSVRNIFKELNRTHGHDIPSHGDLMKWALQGVLLLNKGLTVKQGSAGSHIRCWDSIFKKIITAILQNDKDVILCLWGRFAMKVKDESYASGFTNVLEAGHPSPMNTANPFVGSDQFVEIDRLLQLQGKEPIDWQIV